MTVEVGDLYWGRFKSTIAHPHVVIETSTDQIVICPLTTHLKRVSWPGNVLIPAGEGNLAKTSVIEVSKAITIDPHELGAWIGRLSSARIGQILAGRRMLYTTFFAEHDQA
jgi:mRNA interferase MazF